ncbi:MAG TPA: hypothetical protein VKR32_13615, partial [Puia sp.]|nr:hypothetical protein [Puia sp.]
HKHFTSSEEFPQWAGSQQVILVRSSYKKIPHFILYNLSTEREKSLYAKRISLDNYFSYRNSLIVYSAYESDSRWNWRDYSVVRLLDLRTGVDRKITSATKFFAPDISADGLHVVVARVALNGACQLLILDSKTGNIEKAIPNLEGLFYTYPKFYKDQLIAAAVRNKAGEMAMAIVNPEDGKVEYITPFSMNVVGFPSVYGDTICFTATKGGYDRMFAYTPQGLFEILVPGNHSTTGNYGLQLTDGKLAFSTFSAVGYRMSFEYSKNVKFLPLTNADWVSPLSDESVTALRGPSADLLDHVLFKKYAVSPYSQTYHLINIHSLRPYINDPDYSFSLVSENVLNTLQSELFLDYNRNENYKQIGVDGTYAQLFPWLDAGASYTFGRNGLYGLNKLFWNESQFNAGLSVPLNYNAGLHYRSIQFGSDMVYDERFFRGTYKDSFNTKGFVYVDPFIVFTNQVQQAQMQIYPRLAQTITLNYNRAIASLQGNQLLASAYFYLPGASLTNSLVLGAAFQQHDSLHNVSFSNDFPFSRGYSAENFYRMYRLSANYHFPLAYPDLGLGGVAYILRARANIFYDYTHVLDYFSPPTPYVRQFRSFGVECYLDTKWWNQLPVSFGIRYSRLIDPDFEGRGPNQWEFILPINLLSK